MSDDYSDVEEEIEEIYMESVERKTGSRKKTAAFMLGGAAIGAFAGDILYGREYTIDGDLLANGYSDPYFESHFYIDVVGRDRGGLIEDIAGGDIMGDSFHYSDRYVEIQDAGGFTDVTVDEIEGNYAESVISENQNIVLGLSDGSLNESVTPDGAMIGGGTGAAGGFGADYIKKKKKSN